MTLVRQRLRSFVTCSCMPSLLLAALVLLSPSAAAAQDPEPETDAVDMLRQLRGALESLRGTPTRRSERALSGTVTVSQHRDYGRGYLNCDVEASFSEVLPYTAFVREWGAEEPDAARASVEGYSRMRETGGTYTVTRTQGSETVGANVAITVFEDEGTYRLSFGNWPVTADRTIQYPRLTHEETVDLCNFSIHVEGLPAPRDSDRFAGSHTTEHGVTITWSLQPRAN